MPAPLKKMRSKRFAEYEEKPKKDFDPENETRDDDDDGSASEDSEAEAAGTEHYVAVGKSKLRQKDQISVGPEYRGTRVTREALDESSGEDDEEEEEASGKEGEDDDDESGSEDFADPDTADLEADHIDDDAEIDSDDALAESDSENLKDFTFRGSAKPKAPKSRLAKRPTAADFMPSSEDEGVNGEEDGASLDDDEDEDGDEDEDEEMDDNDDDDDSEAPSEIGENSALLSGEDGEEEDDDDDEDDEDDEDEAEGNSDDERAELRKIMSEGQKSIVATMSQAAKADAEKGAAVRAQRRAFDSILNLRIRLQKALVAANTFSVVDSDQDATEPYQAAEEAALKLWNTIDSVRHSFRPESKAKAGEKRKRDVGADTSSQNIWERMEMIEESAVSRRRKVLDKWSARVRTTAAATKTRRLGDSTSQSLVSVLDDQLMSADRLIKRARTPRSCAPVQAAKKVEEDRDIYDDADFYQLLLKELVDQRSMDVAAPGEFVATVRWAALKEAKTRKLVDRKASKGRKLRYTVHEKLQNFMAPEDRRQWEEHAIDRFFGTMFGQKMELKEDDASDEEMGGASVEEDGLKLFRS
ncbi:apoptosis antagonizing transcription factor-domain-containing protein [Podospora appendiculata]|uniref:Protein BFR2 n=1 Tax=Podospora appendiculata TaxID=314037 RepID=A0AAE1C881_9PEZI|nr:apoptosis antagonizing transcription factor-domain-containing protein [Podospora appendiculata]